MKKAHLDAKERWARKMAGQAQSQPRSEHRLPPGQHLVRDFPVLDLGHHPEIPQEKWRLTLSGMVENPVTFSWDQFMGLPQFHDVSDMHCVTTWSQLDMPWTGVAFLTLAEIVQPKPEVTHLIFKGYDGYLTSTTLETCLDDDVLIAHSWNGHPLTREHGGPARVIIPKKYAWKGTKFIEEIRFLDHDILGYWEERGYSNTADPWSEDRFAPK